MDDESALATPSRGGISEASLFDMGTATPSASYRREMDDSLLGTALGKDAVDARRMLTESGAASSHETAEERQQQLQQLAQLNALFEPYEDAMAGSLEQMEVRYMRGAADCSSLRSGSTRRMPC